MFRSIAVGCAIGCLIGVGNIYMGLKTGWVDGGAITASILGFAILGRSRVPYTKDDNNITQCTATSAGMMAGTAGLLGAFPALTLLGHDYPAWSIALWGLALAVVGIAIAAQLRQRLVIDEELPFPTAIATAEVIEAMHRSGEDARRRAWLLLGTAATVFTLVWFRDGLPKIIPAMTALPIEIAGAPAAALSLGIAWSPMLASAGLLIGPRIGLSLLGGALVARLVLAPLVAGAGIVAGPDYDSMAMWLIWPGVSFGVAAAITSLALDYKTIVRAARDLRRIGAKPSATSLAVPVTIAVVTLVALAWAVFDVSPFATLAGLAISLVLAVLCGRAAGETDINPVGPMGQVTQALAGALVPGGGVTTNIITASIPAGDAAHVGEALWGFKVGHKLGSDPKPQIVAQLVGAVVGALVIIPAYALLVNAYRIGSPELPAPAALTWKAMADVVTKGTTEFPAYAALASAVAIGLGVVFTLLERTKARRFVPSAVAVGVGFLIPAFYAVPICAGGIIAGILVKVRPAFAERTLSTVAAGGIVGEALAGLVVAALIGAGVLSA